MSARLRPVPGKDIVRTLERFGWHVVRIHGSHHMMRHPDVPDIVPVPVHARRPVPRGTLGNILKRTGIDRDDFFARL